MDRLTVRDRKLRLARVIQTKVGGKLTEPQILEIVSKININNQYSVNVITDHRVFEESINLTQVNRYENVLHIDTEYDTFLGGVTVVGKPLLGEVELGETIVEEIHGAWGGGVTYTDITKVKAAEFNKNFPCAVEVVTNNNYLGYDGTGRDYKIKYDINIYIPKLGE